MSKWGIVVSKKEMTKMWIDDKFLPVTLVKILPQEVIRYKTQEKDGYVAVVIGVEKKLLKKEKGQKIAYTDVTEFDVDESFIKDNETGKILDAALLEWVTLVEVTWHAKGKGYQGAIKRFHLDGWPKTHGSKFHRHVGSMGNRKPRRTLKWHPHAGRMGNQQVTLKNISVVDIIKRDDEQIAVLRWSLPGSYNGLLKIVIK